MSLGLIRKYFSDDEEGDIRFFCWLHGLSREQLEMLRIKFEAEKKRPPISIEETIAEIIGDARAPPTSVPSSSCASTIGKTIDTKSDMTRKEMCFLIVLIPI